MTIERLIIKLSLLPENAEVDGVDVDISGGYLLVADPFSDDQVYRLPVVNPNSSQTEQ